jgi:hypothetical protein
VSGDLRDRQLVFLPVTGRLPVADCPAWEEYLCNIIALYAVFAAAGWTGLELRSIPARGEHRAFQPFTSATVLGTTRGTMRRLGGLFWLRQMGQAFRLDRFQQSTHIARGQFPVATKVRAKPADLPTVSSY